MPWVQRTKWSVLLCPLQVSDIFLNEVVVYDYCGMHSRSKFVSYCCCKSKSVLVSCPHSFIFTLAFPLRRVVGAAALGLEILYGQWQSHIVLLASQQDGIKQGRRYCLMLGRPLGHFPVGAASRARLASVSWDILVTWPNRRSWDRSIRRSDLAFRALRILQFCTFLRSITAWTLELYCPFNS